MIKKAALLLAAVMILTSLTACGGSEPAPAAAPAAEAPAAEAAAPEAAAPEAAAPEAQAPAEEAEEVPSAE